MTVVDMDSRHGGPKRHTVWRRGLCPVTIVVMKEPLARGVGVRSLPTTHHPAREGAETSRGEERTPPKVVVHEAHDSRDTASVSLDLHTRQGLAPLEFRRLASGEAGGWGAWPGCGLVGCEPHGPIPAEAATSTPGLAALSTQTRGHRVTEGLDAWITRVGDGETPATRPYTAQGWPETRRRPRAPYSQTGERGRP